MKHSLSKQLKTTFVIILTSILFIGIIWGADQLIKEYYYKAACVQYAKNKDLSFLRLNGQSRNFVPVSATFRKNINEEVKSVPINEILEQGPGKTMKFLHTPLLIIVVLLDIFLWYFVVIKIFFSSGKKKTLNAPQESKEDFLYSKDDTEDDVQIKMQISDLVIKRFLNQTDVDLNTDANAVARVNDYIKKNYSTFQENNSLVIDIPYIYASVNGTFHLNETINRNDL